MRGRKSSLSIYQGGKSLVVTKKKDGGEGRGEPTEGQEVERKEIRVPNRSQGSICRARINSINKKTNKNVLGPRCWRSEVKAL